MTNTEKYKYWEILSDYDIETAAIMLHAKRWMYVATICHASVERLIKGMIVYHTKREAPKSNNLTFLMNKLSENEVFLQTPEGIKFNNEKYQFIDIIIDIMYFHINDYPFSYQKIMERFIEEPIARDIYVKTQTLIKWLKSFQTE